jgi:hypothetical protein
MDAGSRKWVRWEFEFPITPFLKTLDLQHEPKSSISALARCRQFQMQPLYRDLMGDSRYARADT